MNWENYTEHVLRTANPKLTNYEAILSASLGLCGESGEVVEHIKKHYFHNKPLDKQKVLKELGDVCYYLAWLSHSLGLSLNDAMEGNVDKLKQRHPEGFTADYGKE